MTPEEFFEVISDNVINKFYLQTGLVCIIEKQTKPGCKINNCEWHRKKIHVANTFDKQKKYKIQQELTSAIVKQISSISEKMSVHDLFFDDDI